MMVKKSLGQSSPQELEVSPHSRLYLLVLPQSNKLTWLTLFLAVLLSGEPVGAASTASIDEGVAAKALLQGGGSCVWLERNPPIYKI